VRGIKAAIEVEIGAFEVQPYPFATGFNACKPSGNRTMSVVLTGATGTGATMEP
jgi:hypothetical protein